MEAAIAFTMVVLVSYMEQLVRQSIDRKQLSLSLIFYLFLPKLSTSKKFHVLILREAITSPHLQSWS